MMKTRSSMRLDGLVVIGVFALGTVGPGRAHPCAAEVDAGMERVGHDCSI